MSWLIKSLESLRRERLSLNERLKKLDKTYQSNRSKMTRKLEDIDELFAQLGQTPTVKVTLHPTETTPSRTRAPRGSAWALLEHFLKQNGSSSTSSLRVYWKTTKVSTPIYGVLDYHLKQGRLKRHKVHDEWVWSLATPAGEPAAPAPLAASA